MDKDKLEKYRNLLVKEKERFLKSIKSIEHGVEGRGGGLDESFLDSVGDFSAYDNHPADSGDIMLERSKDIALRDNNRTILQMIDDAIQKIDNGIYGKCDACGQEIPEERLEAFPYTTLCINCKNLKEQFDQPRFRPIEEDFLSAPFDRTFTDDSDNVSFDGEDSWQKVARYGTSNTPQDVPNSITYDDTFYDADEKQGEVGFGDGIEDSGFTEDFREDVNTGNPRRRSRGEYR